MTETTAPIALPLRVLVMGASASVMTSWAGGPRTDLAYPRALEAELWAAGRPASVRVSALPGDRIRHAFTRWMEAVIQWSPDVVVLHYGHADSVHLFLPRWLERHANSPRRRGGPVRDAYRRYLLRPVWLGLAQTQQRLDALVPTARETRRHRRIGEQLAALVARLEEVSSPLVLVPTLLRPGPPWERWFPGAADRMALMNTRFEAVVRRADRPNVRIFPLAEIVVSVSADGEEPTPDGGHFTPSVHREIGRALAEVILPWAAEERGSSTASAPGSP